MPLKTIKSNAVYIFSYIVFIVVLIYFVPLSIHQYTDVSEKTQTLDRELEVMATEKSNRESYNISTLSQITEKLTIALPSKEDYFSIYHAIEYIAQLSGVTIVSHESPFRGGKVAELSISVEIIGGKEDIRRFINNIHFKSGRFLTIESLSYKPKERTVSIKVIFYSAGEVYNDNLKEGVAQKIPIQKADSVFIDSLLEDIAYMPNNLKPLRESISSGNYQPKNNPFSYP